MVVLTGYIIVPASDLPAVMGKITVNVERHYTVTGLGE